LESHKRSLIKTISWRVIATVVTLLFSYLWLGEWTSAIALAMSANIAKGLLYYGHERLWNRLKFGRKEIKEDYMI
jgi:uncharacterized membrane protein